MAKSTRSKVKRAFRAKKRTEGVYAAAEAARLQRLNAKLHALASATPAKEKEEEKEGENGQDVDMPAEDVDADADAGAGADTEMALLPTAAAAEGLDGTSSSEQSTGKKISTHGPRASRREQWRASKGMTPRPKARGMSRQGTVASRYKPGRSHRRR
ncbi:hypothetical protein F5148DRAFT_1179358 [Russula earlei]|uniref:Uncharacterized protein n=1 Tax=Russula earlei TaxID=71964 RepID=A0ACC0UFE1_9AGAM|nr:hypothetical protein F5148DRAFT_1179358 [Russula earlei]